MLRLISIYRNLVLGCSLALSSRSASASWRRAVLVGTLKAHHRS